MNQIPQLDPEILEILACPFCKSSIHIDTTSTTEMICCAVCDASFPIRENGVIDFRITPPPYSQPFFYKYWSEGQRDYERWARSLPQSVEYYLEQIKQKKRSIYSVYDFQSIEGIVLDVGGNDGRLRHYLREDVIYVSLDPYLKVREELVHKGRLEAYPVLATPGNFICGRAEQLPFIHGGVDFIRCDSVLDHLWDPFLSLREMYRVLKPGGYLSLCVHVVEGNESTLKDRIKRILKFILHRPQDMHIWHPSISQIKDIGRLTGFIWDRANYLKKIVSLEVVLRRRMIK